MKNTSLSSFFPEYLQSPIKVQIKKLYIKAACLPIYVKYNVRYNPLVKPNSFIVELLIDNRY